MSFPRKEDRIKCYVARDKFWNCLDQYSNDSDEIIVPDACKEFKDMFESNCPTQWVTHFNRKYKYLKFKTKIETGFDPIEEANDSK